MNGWIELVTIEDMKVVLSKELKHITGNITLIKKTNQLNEFVLGTEKGIYFVLIGKGIGILEVEMENFNKQQ